MSGLALNRSLARRQRQQLPKAANLPLQQPVLAMQSTQQLQKVAIVEKLLGSRTAHLLPIVAFLQEQGNTPSPKLSYGNEDIQNGFEFDRDDRGEFLFDKPIDLAAVATHFSLPDTIVFTPDNGIWDRVNRLAIKKINPVTTLPNFD